MSLFEWFFEPKVTWWSKLSHNGPEMRIGQEEQDYNHLIRSWNKLVPSYSSNEMLAHVAGKYLAFDVRDEMVDHSPGFEEIVRLTNGRLAETVDRYDRVSMISRVLPWLK